MTLPVGPCPGCGRTVARRYPGPDQTRVCTRCWAVANAQVCPGCGERRRADMLAGRTPEGVRICVRCRRRASAAARLASQRAALAGRIAELEPGLAPRVIAAAVATAAPTLAQHERLAAHLAAHPDALESGASAAPPPLARLLGLLAARGATRVALPRCAGCQQQVPLGGQTGDGAKWCRTCRYHDTSRWPPCGRCGRHRPTNQRLADGTGLCSSCYTPPPGICQQCGTTAPITSRKDGRAVCAGCYRHPQRRCGGCGRVRVVALRGRDGQPDLCPTCYQAPIEPCSRCGITTRCRRTTPDRSPICFRCQLGDKLTGLLAGPEGTVPAALVPLHQAIMAVDNPLTAIGWLGRSPAVPILQQLAAGELELTHQALDQATASLPERDGRPGRHPFAVEHLRQLLIACGALPDRDPHLARLERFITTQADTLAVDEDRRLLRAWATWQVLRRLRARAAEGKPTVNRAYAARGRISQAARFLTWLRSLNVSVVTCRQTHVDCWFADIPGFADALATRREASSFLAWAVKQRALQGVRLPPRQQRGAAQATDSEQRWALARRLLHDDQLEVADRVAGLLVVLYAQPASRIVRLTLADVTRNAEHTMLRLGTDQVLMPEPLGGLVRQLPTHQPVGMAGRLDASSASAWLFTGRQPDRPLHPQHLRHRLGVLGIPTRATRNAALLQLAAEVPPTVLAELLGLHPHTVIGWVKAAGGDWSRYAAHRSRATSNPPARQGPS